MEARPPSPSQLHSLGGMSQRMLCQLRRHHFSTPRFLLPSCRPSVHMVMASRIWGSHRHSARTPRRQAARVSSISRIATGSTCRPCSSSPGCTTPATGSTCTTVGQPCRWKAWRAWSARRPWRPWRAAASASAPGTTRTAWSGLSPARRRRRRSCRGRLRTREPVWAPRPRFPRRSRRSPRRGAAAAEAALAMGATRTRLSGPSAQSAGRRRQQRATTAAPVPAAVWRRAAAAVPSAALPKARRRRPRTTPRSC
mmetsp:Transcript_61726/g.180362  ORF Transcript_61726/g.180362 Transcript_61726/m.180362 type:complete len:254 (+) Transcript_61726:593-1354(+)